MSIEIVPLAEADIAGVVDCVQSTFADDPYFRWAFDPAKVRATKTPSQSDNDGDKLKGDISIDDPSCQESK